LIKICTKIFYQLLRSSFSYNQRTQRERKNTIYDILFGIHPSISFPFTGNDKEHVITVIHPIFY